MQLKELIRETLIFLHLDLTKNLEYDRLTKRILKQTLREASNCIDVGCHKGEILDMMLKYSPKGSHIAFEPIPFLYDDLKKAMDGKATVFPYALSDKAGTTTFQVVKNALAYSGINKRSYAVAEPDIEEINVELKRLDDLIPAGRKIDLIKIDVEGGELGVLRGATEVLHRDRPVVIFECGLGASEFYGTRPTDVFGVFRDAGLKVSTLKGFTAGSAAMTEAEFEKAYNDRSDYYFIAHP